ncbi:MAG: hypothetical protein M0C28_02665 [Candidatus Moduliflexus flocculans]|nr:hypothetical protein [Candidatus Moduliflexus flocculans]
MPASSRLRLAAKSGERTFAFPADVTAGRWFEPGRASGEAVFLGYGLGAPDLGWDDCAGIDLRGKIAVILEATLPDGHPLRPAENRRVLGGRAGALRGKGAAAVVTIIDDARESRLAERGLAFDLPRRTRVVDIDNAAPGAAPSTAGCGALPPSRGQAGRGGQPSWDVRRRNWPPCPRLSGRAVPSPRRSCPAGAWRSRS